MHPAEPRPPHLPKGKDDHEDPAMRTRGESGVKAFENMGLLSRCGSLKVQCTLFTVWPRFRVTGDRFVDRGAGDQLEVLYRGWEAPESLCAHVCVCVKRLF